MSRVSRNGRALEEAPAGAGTLVLLCGALSELGNGLALADIEQSLQENTPQLRVEIVADLCQNPKALAEAVGESDCRAVLGLCSGDRSGQEFDYHARHAGLDPFGVATVNLGGLCALAHPRDLATGKAIVLLAAVVAKVRAFTGSGPEHVKPHLGWSGQKVSRRALFMVPPITYEPVAAVRADRCMSQAGCDLCTVVCPCDALSVIGGRITVDKNACDGCGLCVTECPRDAIELPTAFLGQFERELEALLTAPGLAPSEPRAILYACDRNVQVLEELAKKRLPYAANWLPVAVPCTGMISPGWILQSLALGASAIGIMACGGECKFGQQERTAVTVAYCHDLLELLGMSRDALRLMSPTSIAGLAEALERPLESGFRPDNPSARSACLREPSATASALASLTAANSEISPFILNHEHSPLGDVRIDVQGCTACESCARACPTDALTSREEGDTLTITFDPNLCTGCSLCVRLCPEDIVSVRKVTDLQALRDGRTILYEDSQARCDRCGAAFAPASMVRRVEQLLQDGGGSSQAIRRCPSCRGFAIGASLAGNVQSEQQKED